MKSARVRDTNQNVDDKFKKDKEETKSQQSKSIVVPVQEIKKIEVWKCPECQYLNKFGESYECGNKNRCKFNLGYLDDLASCIIELAELDFERLQK